MAGKATAPLTPPKSPSAAPLDGEGKWEAIAARKRAEREALLDPSSRVSESSSVQGPHLVRSSILSPQEEEIVCLSATELAAAIRARRYTSVQVIQAYIRAATVAQDITNCLTEICFDAGLKRAAELDAYQTRTGSTVGPLHGVPVSVKDHINMEGTDAATGFVGWAYGRVATKDAVAVRCVRLAGAVIYCKTANPQSLLVGVQHWSSEALGLIRRPSRRTITSTAALLTCTTKISAQAVAVGVKELLLQCVEAHLASARTSQGQSGKCHGMLTSSVRSQCEYRL